MSRKVKTNPQYFIYCRKSTESEERQILSIESQLKELKHLVKSRGYSAPVILTESKSAKYPGRNIFGDLMEKIYRNEVKGIITWKLDRLARNPIDGASLIWALDRGMIEEIITPHGTFNNNSNDKFLMQIEFGMAKKYVDDLSDNVKRGIRAKLEKGWYSGLPPLGYLNNPIERTIIIDPDRFRLIRKLWELLLQGESVRNIAKYGNEKLGIRTRKFKRLGGNPITTDRLYNLFRNSFYYGLIERKEGIFQGLHHPMITEDEFWKAQEILGKKGKRKPKTKSFAFTGLFRCGHCGCMITAEEKINRYGSKYVYYHCTKRKRSIKCSQPSINLNDLENGIVKKYLKNIDVPPMLTKMVLEVLEKEEKEEIQNISTVMESLKKALKMCLKKMGNLNQMKLKELLSDDEYMTEKRILQSEKLRLESSLKNQVKNMKDGYKLTKRAFLIANDITKAFKKGTLQEKREMLQEIGSNFVLMDKKVFIDLEKPYSIIQNYLNEIKSKNVRLELLSRRLNTEEKSFFMPIFSLCSRLSNDVRTFYAKEVIRGDESKK